MADFNPTQNERGPCGGLFVPPEMAEAWARVPVTDSLIWAQAAEDEKRDAPREAAEIVMRAALEKR